MVFLASSPSLALLKEAESVTIVAVPMPFVREFRNSVSKESLFMLCIMYIMVYRGKVFKPSW